MLNDLICFDVIIIYAQKYMFKNAETHTHTHTFTIISYFTATRNALLFHFFSMISVWYVCCYRPIRQNIIFIETVLGGI